MNLRKSSKAALIREIKRLRRYQEEWRKLKAEIKKRHNTTEMYRLITKPAVIWAYAINKAEWKRQTELWDAYWRFAREKIEAERINDFWAERMADLIEEFILAINQYEDIPEDYLNEPQN